MAIAPDSRFGSFEIAESIGAGGMGEVFRARDTSLKRDVALKVLPEAFVNDADRLARFQREAEMLASLNHPNIAQVYGLEKAKGRTAIVMELVEGPTLADRLRDGSLAPEGAIGIALQVVAALEAAHTRQIVHRDLKPDNIKLTRDGTVKVLDFGIAKPLDPSAISGGSPVMTTPAVTQTGVILGTAAYMSPEQARGQFVDQRTDIWAFGCLLFEMLTGQPAFAGEDVMLTLARVLDRATDLSSIPKTISPAVRHTIRLCLEKDPRRRIADIRDVRLALEGAFESVPAGIGDAALQAPMRSRTATAAVALVAGTLITAAAAAILWPAQEPKRITRFEIPIPSEQPLRLPEFLALGLSADGRRLVYNAADSFYRRDLDSLESVPIPGTSGDLVMPMPTRDGEDIDFARIVPNSNGSLERIAASGGPVTTLSDGTRREQVRSLVSASRTPTGTWLTSHRGGVSEFDTSDGDVRLIVNVGDDQRASGARLLPDGETVLFAVTAGPQSGQESDDWQIVAAARSSDPDAQAELTTIVPNGYDPRYIESSGHLLFVRGEDIYAIAFDPQTLTTRGDARAVLPGVRLARRNVAADYEVADNGTLAYLPGDGSQAGPRWAWLDGDGRLEVVTALPPRNPGSTMRFPRLSPDGSRLAIAEQMDSVRNLWVYDLRRPGARTLIAGDDAIVPKGVWSPDGQRLIFYRVGSGLFRRAADASDREELLLPAPDGFDQLVPDWVSPDGRELVVTALMPSGRGIYRLPLTGEATLEPLLDDPDYEEGGSELSPDGRFIAYATNESGSNEIHIRPYPDVTSRRIVVSSEGGLDPLWDARGDFLYYVENAGVGLSGRLLRVPVQTTSELVLGEPERIDAGILTSTVRPNFDHDPGSGRWLVSTLDATQQSAGRTIVVVENWTQWLQQAVPTD